MYLIELQHNPEEKCDKREKIHVVGDANSLLSVIDHKQTKKPVQIYLNTIKPIDQSGIY